MKENTPQILLLWRWGLLLLLAAQSRITLSAEAQPELVPLIEYSYSGILLAPLFAPGDAEPRARLLTRGDNPQTYGSVVQWRDPQSGAVLKVVPLAARPRISDLSASPVTTALAPKGDVLANVGPENVLFWQNPWSGAILQRFPRQSYPLEFSPDGQKFVSQQLGREETPRPSLVVRSVPQGHVLHELELPHRVEWVFWSPDATRLCAVAFADHKQDVRVWDAASGQLHWQAQGEAANFLRAWFLPDGRLAVLDSVNSRSATLRVRLWPIGGGQPTVIPHNYRSTDPDVRWAVLDDGRLLFSVVEQTASRQPNGAATEKRVTRIW
ncbi:MAG TPA: WD40 repeat domain-containing protein, partial [Abditibacteriaceae bacterium]